MLNIKETQREKPSKAFNSGKKLRHKTLGNRYTTPSTIVFIDSAVDDYQSLVNGAIPEAEVIVLDSTQDGVAQITEVLQGRTDIAAIHIVSHGAPGSLQLGKGQLSLDTLDHYATQLKTWSTTLSHTPLLLYGCNVAAGDAGTQFVERLYQLTGADIAASANLTGSAALGGDWKLEVATSKVEAALAFPEEVRKAYASVLATITVNTLIDENDHSITDGDIALRDAIEVASAGDTIDFSVSGIIKLDLTTDGQRVGQLVIDKNLTIDGPGADKLTISGDNKSRVFEINDGKDSNLIDVEIEGLTINNGRASGGGAQGVGGGIFNNENLTVTNSIIRNNESTGFGAGINNNRGTLKLFGSTISNNTIIGFPATGGFFTGGGGISNATGASIEIDRSTISANQANRGGGILNTGSLKLTNSTISGNEAGAGGGGILNFGTAATADLSFSTITQNKAGVAGKIEPNDPPSGGGIFNNGGTVTIGNTILAGNSDIGFPVSSPDARGNFISNGNNLIGRTTGSTGFENDRIEPNINNILNTTLANNGGPTQTHALVANTNNPAIDAVNAPSDITTDQRGVSRPFGINSDIGAVEFVPLPNVSNITVDTLEDENDGDLSFGDVSLREAILFSSAGGTINFDASLSSQNVGFGKGTIGLQLGELVINKDLTINGLGANNLTISGNNASRVFQIDDGNDSNLINVEIEGLTIANGKTQNQGGGIYNSENLTISNSTISKNFVADTGGGIYSNGVLNITHSTISGNTGNTDVGGIQNSGTLTIAYSTISDNITNGAFAGGIRNYGTLEVLNSTISGNSARGSGGGISNSGTLEVTNSTISGNSAGASGGGIYGSSGSLTVTNSTITNNVANIDGDNSFDPGGGDDGGGIKILSGTAEVKNTIIAGNFDIPNKDGTGNVRPDVSGDFTTTDSNLIGDGTGSTGFTNGVNGNIVGTSTNPIDPKLGPLQDNGGSTLTYALLPGSPAINAGNNANIPAGITTDQRGEPRIVGGTVDIGAFEAALPTPGVTRIGTPNNDTLTGGAGNDTLQGLNSQDILQGFAGDDLLDGGDGDDRVSGGEDNDTLLGGSGQDQLFGDNGSDSLDGGDGDDRVSGGEGNDTLLGGQGQDRLFGDSGDDLLNGGTGDNTLTGGLGKDIFVVSTAGKNNIVDFEDGQDLLKLEGGLTFGQLSIFEQNSDTWITTNTNQPLAFLTGVDSNLITAADFTA